MLQSHSNQILISSQLAGSTVKQLGEVFYRTVVHEFGKVLDMNGLSDCYDFKSKRYKIMLHSFRRFVNSLEYLKVPQGDINRKPDLE